SMVASLAGELAEGRLSRARPFRAPHHSASMAAMVGGGARVRPGEISLAHHGVLFLDELPEFARSVVDALRQPLETGEISIARANAHVRYPAKVQLVAAMNPCPCGYGKAAARACGRGPNCETAYQARISGPVLDRIDLHVQTPAVTAADLAAPARGEASAEVAARVAAARGAQAERVASLAKSAGEDVGDGLNARLSPALCERLAAPDADGAALLSKAAEAMGLSARGYYRVLRCARTLADLDGGGGVKRRHVAEAVSYRPASPAAPAGVSGGASGAFKPAYNS
ncbi:MAG: ATP-binding protein, partial [Pseudomonadota bacterium]